ncbi:hypothetical protein TYRP_001704 [Tyrophagus putrescentiae]|nr:hypothetical protein TYRP_001704 [Tyrophagus putrescentiae]
MYVSGAQIKTARSGVTWLTKTPADEGLASEASEVRVGGRFCPKRRGLTTLGHCERPPTRVSRAERAGPESVGVHSAQVSSGQKNENARAVQVAADRDFFVDFVIAFEGKTKQTNQTNVLANWPSLPLLCPFGLDLNMRKIASFDLCLTTICKLSQDQWLDFKSTLFWLKVFNLARIQCCFNATRLDPKHDINLKNFFLYATGLLKERAVSLMVYNKCLNESAFEQNALIN